MALFRCKVWTVKFLMNHLVSLCAVAGCGKLCVMKQPQEMSVIIINFHRSRNKAGRHAERHRFFRKQRSFFEDHVELR